ncbi:MAG: DUF1559 domain-containing protein [Gemmataceae bacterium]
MRDYEDDDLDDRPRRRPRPTTDGGAGKILLILGIVGVVAFVLVGGLIAMLVFAVSRVRTAAERARSQNDLKQVGLAMHNYHDTYSHLPPVGRPTKDGRPGVSWRVEMVPFLEAGSLYKSFNLDEGWDSPTNSSLLSAMPRQYSTPTEISMTNTHDRVFTGGGALFDPDKQLKFTDVKDGLANTVMVVEAADPVPWTKPDELPYQPGGPLPPLGLPTRDSVLVLMADGSVRYVKKTASAASWHAAISRAGGDAPGPDW